MNKLNELQTLRMIYLLQLLSITEDTSCILAKKEYKNSNNPANIKIKLEDYPIDFYYPDEALEEF